MTIAPTETPGCAGNAGPGNPSGHVDLDEPARLDVAAVGPLAGDARGEKLLGARLPVERREVDRHALSLDVDHLVPAPLSGPSGRLTDWRIASVSPQAGGRIS